MANLNADKLDGQDNTAFALTAGKTGYVTDTGYWDSGYIVAVAQCPNGTRLTGGGYFDNTSTGYVAYSGPSDGGSWLVIVAADTTDNAADVESYAVCYNPRGAVPGATATLSTTSGVSKVKLLSKVARK